MRSFNLQLVGKFICKEKKHIFNDSSGMGDGDTEAEGRMEGNGDY